MALAPPFELPPEMTQEIAALRNEFLASRHDEQQLWQCFFKLYMQASGAVQNQQAAAESILQRSIEETEANNAKLLEWGKLMSACTYFDSAGRAKYAVDINSVKYEEVARNFKNANSSRGLPDLRKRRAKLAGDVETKLSLFTEAENELSLAIMALKACEAEVQRREKDKQRKAEMQEMKRKVGEIAKKACQKIDRMETEANCEDFNRLSLQNPSPAQTSTTLVRRTDVDAID